LLDSTSDIFTAELIHGRVHSNTNSHIQPAHVWLTHHDTANAKSAQALPVLHGTAPSGSSLPPKEGATTPSNKNCYKSLKTRLLRGPVEPKLAAVITMYDRAGVGLAVLDCHPERAGH
jgi:hypothetical protein